MTQKPSTRQKQKTRNENRDETTPRAISDVTPLLTPNDVAIRLNVTAEQVRSLIRSGRLQAVNVGTGKKRPLYRLSAIAVDEFIKNGSSNKEHNGHRAIRRLPRIPDFFPELR
jgi:excisionase family DNA binding protein